MLQNLSTAQRRRVRAWGLTVLTSVLAVSAFVEGCDGGSNKKVAFTPAEGGEAGEVEVGAAGTRAVGGTGGSGGTRGVTTAGNGGVSGDSDLGGAAGANDAGGSAGSAVGGSAGTAGAVATGGGGAGGGGGMSGSGGAATCNADLKNDLNNCGACGHVCAGDQCTYGHCAKALAKTLTAPIGIQVDDTYAYYGNAANGQISRVALAGGTPTAIVTAGIASRSEELLLLGDELYWTTNADQSVLKAPKAGGTASPISTTESIPYGIASNGTDLFWANHYQSANSIGHALISGVTTKNPIISGTPQVQYPSYVAADATYVYWGNAGQSGTDASVYRAKLDGTEPVALAKNLGPVYGLAIDTTTVYFTTFQGKQVLSVPKTSDGSIAPTVLSDGQDVQPYAIHVDGNDIYWIESFQSLVRHRSKTGTAPETIGSTKLVSIDRFLGDVVYFTLDATHLYWTDGGTQTGDGAVVSLSRNSP